MKQTVLDMLNAIDPALIDAHIRYDERLTVQKSRSRLFRLTAIAATLALLSATLLTVFLLGNRPAPYAFMDHDGFYEVDNGNIVDSPFRHDDEKITIDNTAPVPSVGNVPDEITVNGVTHRVTVPLSNEGTSLHFALDAPKYHVPYYNENDIPSVLFDAATGTVTGISHVALDITPGLSKTVEEYTEYATRAIKTYLPYLHADNLRVKNAVSMKEHTSEYSLGFILFDYYVKEVRTAIRVSVFFGGGTIFSIGVYDYFDLTALDESNFTYSQAEHQTLLTSFTNYALGDMELIEKTLSEGVLVLGAKGSYAISYDLTLKARDADGTVHESAFVLEIELD